MVKERYRTKGIFTLMIIFSFVGNIYGQITISGQIFDNKKETQSRINVLAYSIDQKHLVAFAISNESGYYSISINQVADSLDIVVSSIQFENSLKRVAVKTQTVDFELNRDTKKLEEIEVIARPIEKYGDTLQYLVSAFARQDDRSIEDVLKRMPGIEVKENGQITYQGTPIEKFYVEGLDLMEGRYAMISKNLPKNSVSSVDVMENHQPIRMLEDKMYSDQASLNIKLKKDVAITGTAILGGGFSPPLWKANLTPMLFTKKVHSLVSYQTNNMGIDVSKQIEKLSYNDDLSSKDFENEFSSILSIENHKTPQIEEQRFLDNNIHLVNFNTLIKLNNDYQLRANFYYVNDFRHQSSEASTQLFQPTDTIKYSETYSNKYFDNYMNGVFTIFKNTNKNYFNNKTKIKASWNSLQADVVRNNQEDINQSNSMPFTSISNEFVSYYEIGKRLLKINSSVDYFSGNQSLQVMPGPFEIIINQGDKYKLANQLVNSRRFYTNNYASITYGLKRWKISPNLGFEIQHYVFDSEIEKENNDLTENAGKLFNNDLLAHQVKVYGKTNIEYRSKKWTVITSIPLSWYSVFLEDKVLKEGQSLIRFYADPNIKAVFEWNSDWKMTSYLSYSNRIENINQIRYAYILRNYREISKNSAPVSESQNIVFRQSIQYRNAVNAFFNTLTYSYFVRNRNIIYDKIVQQDGTALVQANFLPNTAYIHSLHLNSSKYVSKLRSTFRLNLLFNHQRAPSLLNRELFETKNILYLFSPGLNLKIFVRLNLDYSLEIQQTDIFIENEKKNTITTFKQKGKLLFLPTNEQMIYLLLEHYNIDAQNDFFVDLNYQFSIPNTLWEIKLSWNNILNNRSYRNLSANSYNVTESVFLLRPSQFMVSVRLDLNALFLH